MNFYHNGHWSFVISDRRLPLCICSFVDKLRTWNRQCGRKSVGSLSSWAGCAKSLSEAEKAKDSGTQISPSAGE